LLESCDNECMPDDPERRHDENQPTLTEPSSPLARSTIESTEAAVDVGGELDADESFASRYKTLAKLGEGGMGEVHLCADRRIGREVAMKVVRTARAERHDLRRRFLREARVQGQLEHPAIVPVYDLGRDPHGAAFFTMKRVRGKTLETLLDGLRAGDAEARTELTRHKLLSVFGSVCLAVHFAHTRGVLHRDLKPSNVMLGDFGEVYVLDWGLAKVALDPEEALSSEGRKPVSGDATLDPAPVETAHGAVMGTAGYMAPEQVRGVIDGLDARADVYGLGAILFELLTLVPLHGYGSAKELMASTVLGVDACPSRRAPARDVPPELDAICLRAAALDAHARFASARELYEAVESFLSGDRDVERRRELALEHARAASEAATLALGGGAHAVDDRRRAMREVSRAVALDPENEDALKTLVRLFTAVPDTLPIEAAAELDAAHLASQRVSARTLGYAYLTWLLYSPLVLWMGLRNGTLGAVCDVLWIGAAAASFFAARTPVHMKRATDVVLVLSTAALACSAGLFGPFTLLPGVAAVNTISFVMAADRSRRVPSIVMGCLAIALPFALSSVGIIPAQTVFRDGAIVLLPQIHAFPETPTLVFLLLTNLAVVVTASIFVARFRDALVLAERRLYFQSWQLRQLVPRGALE
jgi:tRNA A-37 threonylcarbamoyl transferase component Bud32